MIPPRLPFPKTYSNAEILPLLLKAKERLPHEPCFREFICWAICADYGNKTPLEEFVCERIVQKRVECRGYTTYTAWLNVNHPDVYYANPNAQALRHAWLDDLIKEFSEPSPETKDTP